MQRFPWFEGKLSFGDEVSTGWGNWLTAHTCEARSCSRLLQAHGSFEVLLLAGTGDTCRAASNKLRPSFPGVVGISKSNASWVAQIPSSSSSLESLPPLPLTLKHHCFSLGLYLCPHPMPPSDLPAFPLASHKKPASKISKESNKKSKIAKTKVNKDKVNYKETEIR